MILPNANDNFFLLLYLFFFFLLFFDFCFLFTFSPFDFFPFVLTADPLQLRMVLAITYFWYI